MSHKQDWELIRRFSEKGYEFPIRPRNDKDCQESCKDIAPVKKGVIHSRSGYFAISCPFSIDVYCDRTNSWDIESIQPGDPCRGYSEPGIKKSGNRFLINYNSKDWNYPVLTQGEEFVTFGAGGDGLFPVLSSKDRLYVATYKSDSWDFDMPDRDIYERIRKSKGKVEVKYGSEKFQLEGFASVEGGIIGITDPKIHRVSKREHHKGEIITIAKVEPGEYSCEFIESGEAKGLFVLSKKRG